MKKTTKQFLVLLIFLLFLQLPTLVYVLKSYAKLRAEKSVISGISATDALSQSEKADEISLSKDNNESAAKAPGSSAPDTSDGRPANASAPTPSGARPGAASAGTLAPNNPAYGHGAGSGLSSSLASPEPPFPAYKGPLSNDQYAAKAGDSAEGVPATVRTPVPPHSPAEAANRETQPNPTGQQSASSTTLSPAAAEQRPQPFMSNKHSAETASASMLQPATEQTATTNPSSQNNRAQSGAQNLSAPENRPSALASAANSPGNRIDAALTESITSLPLLSGIDTAGMTTAVPSTGAASPGKAGTAAHAANIGHPDSPKPSLPDVPQAEQIPASAQRSAPSSNTVRTTKGNPPAHSGRLPTQTEASPLDDKTILEIMLFVYIGIPAIVIILYVCYEIKNAMKNRNNRRLLPSLRAATRRRLLTLHSPDKTH